MNHPANETRTLCHHRFAPSAAAPAHTCGSPALRGERFCFYHHPTRKPVTSRTERQARIREHCLARRIVNVPLPQTRTELLASLNQVMALIANHQIDLRRAGLLLETLDTLGKLLRE